MLLYSVNIWQRKPWQIWLITGGSPNFTIQILTISRDIYKESKQAGIRLRFSLPKIHAV